MYPRVPALCLVRVLTVDRVIAFEPPSVAAAGRRAFREALAPGANDAHRAAAEVDGNAGHYRRPPARRAEGATGAPSSRSPPSRTSS